MTNQTIDKLMQLAFKHWLKNQMQEVIQNLSLNQKAEDPVENDDLITQAELKRRLGISSITLWRYRTKQGMPYLKKGKKIYYEFNKVKKYIGGLRYDM
jgi:hypothetical protein